MGGDGAEKGDFIIEYCGEVSVYGYAYDIVYYTATSMCILLCIIPILLYILIYTLSILHISNSILYTTLFYCTTHRATLYTPHTILHYMSVNHPR